MNETSWYQRVLSYRKPNGRALSPACCAIAEVLERHPDGWAEGNIALAKAINAGNHDKDEAWKAQWISRLLKPMKDAGLVYTVATPRRADPNIIVPNMREEERP
ncbi:hypothetical protein [Corynebacterium variabile]|uniref:hypothetical protein n=1 Tax=Corynebacterium variabile TaxID=1727 RepID=UPI003BAEC1FB